MSFSSLTMGELERLRSDLERSAILTPASALAIERTGIEPTAARNIAQEFAALEAVGFDSAKICRLLSSLIDDRRAQMAQQASIEMVVSGPDIGQRARDTAVVVDQLFGEATTSVLVVGFAIFDGAVVFRRLIERLEQVPTLDVAICLDISRKGVDTTREEILVSNFADQFVTRHWPCRKLPRLYYDPRALALDASHRAVLHAKCIVVNEAAALVTSANPTPAAYQRNIELGLVVRNSDLPRAISTHFKSLISRGVLRQAGLSR